MKKRTIILSFAASSLIFAVITFGVYLYYLFSDDPKPPPVIQNTNSDPLFISHENFERRVIPKVKITEPKLSPRVIGNYEPIKDSRILIAVSDIQSKLDPYLEMYDSQGNVIRTWELTNKTGGSIQDRRILPNGNILFMVMMDGVYEMDWEGNIVWSYFDDDISHHAEYLPNGNLLVVGTPCDCVKEIDRETKTVVWYWDAHESFPVYNEQTYIGYREENSIYTALIDESPLWGHDWTHINYAQWLPETDTFMISLRNFNIIAEVNRAGDIIWTYGPGILKRQHYPYVAKDRTITIYDNGNGRTIRVNKQHEILFEYKGFIAPFLGDNMYLEDGNYKTMQTIGNIDSKRESDVRIVSPEGEILWKMTFGYVNVYRVDIENLK